MTNNIYDCHVPESRYHRDPSFKALVDTLHAMICKATYTPTEVREAALLACIHHDSHTARQYYLDKHMYDMSQRSTHE